MDISENVARIKQNIAEAAAESGRETKDIFLLAATKTNSADRIRLAVEAGVDICGENRVQEMLAKLPLGAYEGCPLHFIGHLQKNKVKQVVGVVQMIQGVDSLELLSAINNAAADKELTQDLLLEINIANEGSKSGFLPSQLGAALDAASKLSSIRVRGLMAIPPICSSGEDNKPYFEQMNKLFVDNRGKKYDNVCMDFMSMGMSGDYYTAIVCGANMVRIGSAIFGPRVYP